MKRLHVHVSVAELSASVAFYSRMFGSEPTVVKSDYAKWMLDNPRMNFAISQRSPGIGVNHLGIQVESPDELAEMGSRLSSLQTSMTQQENAACCYVKSDKYWVNDPSGIAWETFHTLDTIPVFGTDTEPEVSDSESGNCCIPLAKSENTQSCCIPEQDVPKKASSSCCG